MGLAPPIPLRAPAAHQVRHCQHGRSRLWRTQHVPPHRAATPSFAISLRHSGLSITLRRFAIALAARFPVICSR